MFVVQDLPDTRWDWLSDFGYGIGKAVNAKWEREQEELKKKQEEDQKKQAEQQALQDAVNTLGSVGTYIEPKTREEFYSPDPTISRMLNNKGNIPLPEHGLLKLDGSWQKAANPFAKVGLTNNFNAKSEAQPIDMRQTATIPMKNVPSRTITTPGVSSFTELIQRLNKDNPSLAATTLKYQPLVEAAIADTNKRIAYEKIKQENPNSILLDLIGAGMGEYANFYQMSKAEQANVDVQNKTIDEVQKPGLDLDKNKFAWQQIVDKDQMERAWKLYYRGAYEYDTTFKENVREFNLNYAIRQKAIEIQNTQPSIPYGYSVSNTPSKVPSNTPSKVPQKKYQGLYMDGNEYGQLLANGYVREDPKKNISILTWKDRDWKVFAREDGNVSLIPVPKPVKRSISKPPQELQALTNPPKDVIKTVSLDEYKNAKNALMRFAKSNNKKIDFMKFNGLTLNERLSIAYLFQRAGIKMAGPVTPSKATQALALLWLHTKNR